MPSNIFSFVPMEILLLTEKQTLLGHGANLKNPAERLDQKLRIGEVEAVEIQVAVDLIADFVPCVITVHPATSFPWCFGYGVGYHKPANLPNQVEPVVPAAFCTAGSLAAGAFDVCPRSDSGTAKESRG